MPRVFKLDSRLQKVYDLYPECGIGADIGSDHGKLPCSLLIHNKCSKMIISDISAKCLEKARKLASIHKLEHRIFFEVADGFDALTKDVSCVSITGMGGRCISKILEKPLKGDPLLIISAHSDLPFLRRTLIRSTYKILDETVLKENNRFYNILRVQKGVQILEEKEIQLGFALRADSNETLRQYYKWKTKVEKQRKPHNKELLRWLREEIDND